MAKKKEGLSIIDKDCSVEGTLNIKGRLIVAGSLKGTLIGNHVITTEGSRVRAIARVREMTIGGDFQGEIAVQEDLHILRTGTFTGKATCKRIRMETGGKLNGEVTHLESDAVPPKKEPARRRSRGLKTQTTEPPEEEPIILK